MNRCTLTEINTLPRDSFIRVLGRVFENSQWVAGATWSKRPFANLDDLHQALCESVTAAGMEKQLALIRAYPDLVGRLALGGGLSKESMREQNSAGLDRLTPEEIETFQGNNAAYRHKFGFPFVICARSNSKESIIESFEARLKNSREQEFRTALEELFKIARFRLADIFSP